MGQVKWYDRKFNFDIKQNIFPSIIERLWGTPFRLQEKLKSVPSIMLTSKINNTWSVKENTGHLIDLEPLWQGRLQDIINGQIELRPTDLQNSKTTLANHNDTPTGELINAFKQQRQKTIFLLEDIDEPTVFKSALHPRLKTPMRTMDLFLFVAEHDDYHLARITELVKLQEGKNSQL
jgi:uncharacterized damage-inducible protein DinB